jgi:hypothetical protein
MDADLHAVADALVELAEAELHALTHAANEFILCAAGFITWLEHAADWELNRRAGLNFPLKPPHAAIAPEEHSMSVEVATILRDRFTQTPREDHDAVVGLFDAVLGALVVGRARSSGPAVIGGQN